MAIERTEVADSFFQQRFILFFSSEFNDVSNIVEAGVQPVDREDYAFQGGAFFTQFLCIFGVIPDPGICKL